MSTVCFGAMDEEESGGESSAHSCAVDEALDETKEVLTNSSERSRAAQGGGGAGRGVHVRHCG